MDLTKEAKDHFSRTTKRNKKNHRSQAVQLQSDEQVLRVSIAANSEVALVQINILLAQLDRLTETVSEASQRSGRERVIDLVCRAKKQIESAERLLETMHRNLGMRVSESDSTQSLSSASDEEVRPLARARSMDTILKGDTFARPRNPIQETHSTSCTDTSGEGIYEVVDDEPIQVHVAVTGEKKKIRPKPPTKPKPIGRPSTIIQPRENERKKMKSSTLPLPKKQPMLPPLARLHSKQTTQGESTRQPTNTSSNSDLAYTMTGYVEVDEDFTGSSNYTGTGTGDSGFGGSALPRRRPLQPKAPTQSQPEASNGCYETVMSVRPEYYKSLNKDTVEAVAYEVPQAPLYMNSFSKK